MTKFSVALRYCGLLLLGFMAFTNVQALECKSPVLANLVLDHASCEQAAGLTKFVLKSNTSSSPYATDFDLRHVVIVKSNRFGLVQEAAGIKGSGTAMLVSETRLITPPVETQIVNRKVNKRPTKRGKWVIFTERVQYGAQVAAGFVLDCSTAVRQLTTEYSAVAECYPLEEKARFWKMLESEI